MKRGLALVVVAATTLVLSGGASANPTIPTVRKPVAKKVVEKYLRLHFADWAYRDSGKVNCNDGRINRTHWRCRARWTAGHRCTVGHVRITADEFRGGEPWYWVNGIFFRC